MAYPNISGSWQCSICYQWVPNNTAHFCTGTQPWRQQTHQWPQPLDINLDVLERIAKALEAMTAQLTQLSADKNRQILICAECGGKTIMNHLASCSKLCR